MTIHRRVWWAAIVAVMAVMGVAVAVGLRAVQDNAADVTAAQTEIESLRDAVALANQRLEAQGSVPVAVPDVVTPPEAGATGGQGERGFQGATGAQGLTGLQGVLGLIGPAGPQGVPGETGPRGLSGADGPAGMNGADGAPGPAGPAGADSTVPGPAGPAGPAGADGRGLASLNCVPDGAGSTYWVITFTDGTTAAVTGPCRITPVATP